MVGWLTVKDKTCVTYDSHVDQDSASLQSAHAPRSSSYKGAWYLRNYNTTSFLPKKKQSYSLSIFLCSNSTLSYILHQSSIAYQSSNYLEAILSNAFNESFIDLLGLVLMFSSSGSLTTEDFCGDFATGSSGTKCSRLRRISFVGVSIM